MKKLLEDVEFGSAYNPPHRALPTEGDIKEMLRQELEKMRGLNQELESIIRRLSESAGRK